MSTQSDQPRAVFISYCTQDSDAAQTLCSLLEERGIPCWIAPRNITPGKEYGEEIINALEAAQALVLVMSESANGSRHVANEVARAFSKGKVIMPVRIAKVQPSKAIELFVSSAHWVEAWSSSLPTAADLVAGAVRPLLTGTPATSPAATAAAVPVPTHRWHWGYAVAAVAVLIMLSVATWMRFGRARAVAEPVQRGVASVPNVPAVRPPPVATLVPNYHALVIGINDYAVRGPEGWGPLASARQDAEAVATLLETQYRFEVRRLFDRQATRSALMRELDALMALGPGDAVLIYFAGHGYYDKALNEGYWIPADARMTDGTRQAREDWLWNSVITKMLAASPAQHILVIADSCYGGSLFRGVPDGTPQPGLGSYLRALEKPSRYLISSGGMEPVLDGGGQHSVFAKGILDYLGHTDKEVFAASELGLALRETTSGLTGQLPTVGPLALAGHAGGEFVFVKPAAVPKFANAEATAPVATPGTTRAATPPPADAAARQQVLQQVVALGQSGATNSARRLLESVTQAGADDHLLAAVTAYLDQMRRAQAQTSLKELIQTIEQRKAAGASGKPADADSAKPRILACLGPQITHGGSDADSLALLYRVALRAELERHGGLQVIEREAIEQLVQEMNLGSSALADSRASTTIGKLLPAGLILLGDILPQAGGDKIYLRLVDTETTRILGSFTATRKPEDDMGVACEGLVTQIVARAIQARPLTARVTGVRNQRLQAGVGKFHGAQDGMHFALLRRTPDGGAGDYREEKAGKAKLVALGEMSSDFEAEWLTPAAADAPGALWVCETIE